MRNMSNKLQLLLQLFVKIELNLYLFFHKILVVFNFSPAQRAFVLLNFKLYTWLYGTGKKNIKRGFWI